MTGAHAVPTVTPLEVCPCCCYDHGSYFPDHAGCSSAWCRWRECSECGAIVRPDGSHVAPVRHRPSCGLAPVPPGCGR